MFEHPFSDSGLVAVVAFGSLTSSTLVRYCRDAGDGAMPTTAITLPRLVCHPAGIGANAPVVGTGRRIELRDAQADIARGDADLRERATFHLPVPQAA